MEHFIARYWGKAQPKDQQEQDWHPVAYHGLDVAAAGAALFDARPKLLRTLAVISGLPESVARQWFLFGLALHDIGKLADCFQCKVPERWHHKHSWTRGPAADPGHGRIGATLWSTGCRSFRSRGGHPFAAYFGADAQRNGEALAAFESWFNAICGHHGRPVEASGGVLSDIISAEALADASNYVEACARLIAPCVPIDCELPDANRMIRSSWLVAGLAMLADWIGSNQAWFNYTAPVHSLDAYWAIAQERAHNALIKSGLSVTEIACNYTLAEALPGISHPTSTPLQDWAANDVVVQGQSLIVIEDLTGAGKTEAGLIVAHRLMRAGAAEGLYWALPTMATADVLYRRLADSYRNLFDNPAATSLVLAHSAREFNDVFRKSIEFGGTNVIQSAYSETHEDDGDANLPASAACARWIADDRRKTFLADVGVGTIDQAVLGILPSKHQAMRLVGLSRRVLVVDEIHSLDAYQNALVEALLEFHAALGGSAILISATLTLAARQKLAKAFARGAGWPAPKLVEPHFPLATIIDQQGAHEQRLKSGRGTRRDLPVRRLDDAASAMAVLSDAAREGRAAVWIRNTVQDALDAQRDLQGLLPDVQIGLFHARFALGDRLRIQEGVLESFGRASEGKQRQRILIATQVVEQSIDADWDVMISDLAPVDLLIQRAGRLHRHDHRPPRATPVLHVVGPEPTADAGPKWFEAAFPRGAYVYDHHGQLWLTMKALLDAGGLNLLTGDPRELIEYVYSETAFPAGLEMPSGKAVGAELSERATGRMNALELGKGYIHHAGAWASDTRTPTRLGDPARTLRLAHWDGERLEPWMAIENGDRRKAWRLSEVSVLAKRVADIAAPGPALKRAIATEMSTWPERYDPPLLVPLVQDGDQWRADVVREGDESLMLRYTSDAGLRFETT
jgi:CRISPR-associated endonuclease/helicase Cas3